MRGTVIGESVVSQANTPEYRDNHERIFRDRKPQRGVFVSRCSACDGVQHEPGARLYRCPRCGQETYGSVDIAKAPPPMTADAKYAPLMVDRFMEGAVAMDGTDIGSRAKRAQYMRRNGLADASDVSSEWARSRREAKDRAVTEKTHRTVVEISKTDTRNLPKAVEELRGKR